MYRVLAALVLFFSFFNHCQAAETLEISGLITAGQSLGSGIGGFNPNVPLNINSPVPYVGRFTYRPEMSDAQFRFVLEPNGFNVEHLIGSKHSPNFFSSVEQFDGEKVRVDYLPYLNSSYSILNFTLDRATGLGNWKWFEYCGGCRAVLPQATGTITSFRVVPEPGTAAWAVFLASLGALSKRRHRVFVPSL
jgi:hypothetical protein